MLLCACAYGVKSEISLDSGDSASNAVVKRSVVNQRCAECVCLYTMDFVSAGKKTLLLYVTVCAKVVPRLNKHDDVIKWNFMKIAPPEMKSWLRPWLPLSYNCKCRQHRRLNFFPGVGQNFFPGEPTVAKFHFTNQARNQLGSPGGAKSFLRGAQIFYTMSNSFKLCPTHFSTGVETHFST